MPSGVSRDVECKTRQKAGEAYNILRSTKRGILLWERYRLGKQRLRQVLFSFEDMIEATLGKFDTYTPGLFDTHSRTLAHSVARSLTHPAARSRTHSTVNSRTHRSDKSKRERVPFRCTRNSPDET